MSATAPQITILTIVYSTVYSGGDQRKHQSSASLAFVQGFTGDRWIPRIKGQWRGKCFHLMTSSWWSIRNKDTCQWLRERHDHSFGSSIFSRIITVSHYISKLRMKTLSRSSLIQSFDWNIGNFNFNCHISRNINTLFSCLDFYFAVTAPVKGHWIMWQNESL